MRLHLTSGAIIHEKSLHEHEIHLRACGPCGGAHRPRGWNPWREGKAQAQTAPDYKALLAATDRSDADRKADQRRNPLPFLVFTGARPGMKVLDMGAGAGYSTELMARAVAPNGVVYGQNPADMGDKQRAAFEARLETPAMKDAVADYRPLTIRSRRACAIST